MKQSGAVRHHGHGHKYLDGYSADGYYNDYTHNYESNNDFVLIASGVVFGLALMAAVCCICVIISFLGGVIVHKWCHQYSSKEQRRKSYQNMNQNDLSDQCQV